MISLLVPGSVAESKRSVGGTVSDLACEKAEPQLCAVWFGDPEDHGSWVMVHGSWFMGSWIG